jgi:hypothetical protein
MCYCISSSREKQLLLLLYGFVFQFYNVEREEAILYCCSRWMDSWRTVRNGKNRDIVLKDISGIGSDSALFARVFCPSLCIYASSAGTFSSLAVEGELENQSVQGVR